MTFYRFDEVDPSGLDLVPMAARRALDRAGLKVSLAGWKTLELPARRAIASAGAAAIVDVEAVKRAVRGANPPTEPFDAIESPPSDHVPTAVQSALGDERRIPDALWASLSALDRYTLHKVASRGKPERLDAAYDEIVGATATSTHLAPDGGVRMVGVGRKPVTERRAVAEARVDMNDEAFARLVRADAPKGDVLGTARLAGIQAAKRTSDIVPLCHPVALTHAGVRLELDEERKSVRIEATVEAVDRTGVEMEAMTAACAAALTVYDMLKAFDRGMRVGPIRLLAKSGGRSGSYENP